MADTAGAAANAATGQPHDRIPPRPGPDATKHPSTMPAEENDAPEDISITQKMLSAVTGSILTSLLGTFASNLDLDFT